MKVQKALEEFKMDWNHSSCQELGQLSWGSKFQEETSTLRHKKGHSNERETWAKKADGKELVYFDFREQKMAWVEKKGEDGGKTGW